MATEDPKYIRVLHVKQPWASLIVEGLKPVEVRSTQINIRETIAIYATRSKPDSQALMHLVKYFDPDELAGLPSGCIIGTVKIADSICYTDADSFCSDHNRHYNPPFYFNSSKLPFGWVLEEPHKLSYPIPYKPPTGAIVWSMTEYFKVK